MDRSIELELKFRPKLVCEGTIGTWYFCIDVSDGVNEDVEDCISKFGVTYGIPSGIEEIIECISSRIDCALSVSELDELKKALLVELDKYIIY